MILIVLAFILTASFFYSTKLFPYILVLYFVFYDMFDGFYKDDKIYAVFRYVIPLCLIFFYIIKHKVAKKIDAIFALLVGYLIVLWIINPGDLLITSKTVLPVLITLIMIPIGQHLGESDDFITEFEKYNRILLIAIPLYIVYANMAGIAGFYSDAFSTGFLITSRMYVVPIVVFLAIHYTLTGKEKNWMLKMTDVTFIVINICMLLINTRRTTLAMLAAALLVYTLFNKKLFFKMIMMICALIAVLVISYPIYQERLTAQLEKRDRIQHIDSYDEEARYLETLYIIDYHKKNGDITEMLCGVKLFDTIEFGLRYFGRDRPIHSDINMIFFSTGIIGVLLFAMFFIHYFLKGNALIPETNMKLYYPLLINFLIILIPGRFIGTLTFAPLLMLLLAAFKFGDEASALTEDEEEKLPVYSL